MKWLLLILVIYLSLFKLAISDTLPDPEAGLIVVEVSPFALSRPISSSFISFSIEVDLILQWTGRYPDPPRPALINMMKQLGRPVFRIGGDSTDYSWYNPDGLPYPDYKTRPFRYNITDIDIRSIYAAVKGFGGGWVQGMNFRNESVSPWSLRHLQALANIVGFTGESELIALEIGNEVDFYGGNLDRSRNWNPAAYYANFKEYVTGFRGTVVNLPEPFTQSATYGGNLQWIGDLPNFVAQSSIYMNLVSFHHYPTETGKTNLTTQLYNNITSIGPAILTGSTAGGNLVEKLGAYGIPIVVGEGNSMSEPGTLGVCDVFGVSLWVIDEFFGLAAVGLYRFHTHSHIEDLRAPFYFYSNVPTIRPLWYGLVMFARAIAGEPSVLQFKSVYNPNELVKIWAVKVPATPGTNNEYRIMVIHKDINSKDSQAVQIDLSLVAEPLPPFLWAITLMAPSPYEKYNITLAGQTYYNTQDGFPIGTFTQQSISRQIDGTYRLDVQPGTAVLISTVQHKPFTAADIKSVSSLIQST